MEIVWNNEEIDTFKEIFWFYLFFIVEFSLRIYPDSRFFSVLSICPLLVYFVRTAGCHCFDCKTRFGCL